MKNINIGFIGTDVHIHDYIDGFLHHPRVNMMGFCQTEIPSQRATSQVLEVGKTFQIYQNTEELVEDTQISAVVVCSPDYLHAEHTLMALEAGKHVLCEKPLTDNLRNCQNLIEKVKQTGLTCMVSQFMRFQPIYQRIKQIYDQGQIGNAFFIEGSYIHDMRPYYQPMTWRSNPNNPQNILIGGGCHPMDLMRWTVNSEVVSVHAFSNGYALPDFPLDDCYILSFQFENGCVGKLLATSGCRGHGMGEGFLSIYGTEGTIWKNQLYTTENSQPETIEVTDESSAIHTAVEYFLDSVANGTPPPIDVMDGAKTVSALVAGVESAKTGQRIHVDQLT